MRIAGGTEGAAYGGWQMNQDEQALVNAALAYRRAVARWDALAENEDIAAGIVSRLGSATNELVRCKRALFEACDEYERVPD